MPGAGALSPNELVGIEKGSDLLTEGVESVPTLSTLIVQLRILRNVALLLLHRFILEADAARAAAS
jgi:hypothetical protein